MKTKQLLTVLRREDRGVKNDAQYSPYFPSHRFIVYVDYGHPTELGAHTFRTKGEAEQFIKTRREASRLVAEKAATMSKWRRPCVMDGKSMFPVPCTCCPECGSAAACDCPPVTDNGREL